MPSVVVLWRPSSAMTPHSPERFLSALRAGGRYVRYSPVVRRILLRATLFLFPASALWGLLPLVASRRLGLGPSGYGLLLGALGVGPSSGRWCSRECAPDFHRMGSSHWPVESSAPLSSSWPCCTRPSGSPGPHPNQLTWSWILRHAQNASTATPSVFLHGLVRARRLSDLFKWC